MSETTEMIAAITAGIATVLGGMGSLGALWAKRTADAAKQDATEAKQNATDAKQNVGGAQASASEAGTKAKEAWDKALEALSKAEEARTKAQIGVLELQLRVYLSSRRDAIHAVARELETVRDGRKAEEIKESDRVRLGEIQNRWMSVHEDFLGALEIACRLYRDGKVDADSFRRLYESEVQSVAGAKEGNPFRDLMFPSETSKFKALWLTYRDWFQRE